MKRTGRAVLFIIAVLSPVVVAGCSQAISGTGRANPGDLAAYKAEVHDKHIKDVTTTACEDFRAGRIQVIRAVNDVVDAYNTEDQGYDGPTVGPKLTTALNTIDKWTGTVGKDLVPDVRPEIKTPVDSWRQSATGVADSLKQKDDPDTLNAKGNALNTAADTAQDACALY